MPIPRCPTASVDEHERRHGGRGYLHKNRAAALSRPDSGIPTSCHETSSAGHLRSPLMAMTLVDRALSIGADPRETADERFGERLLVGVALIILPFGFVWGCLYWAIGEQAVRSRRGRTSPDRRSVSPSTREPELRIPAHRSTRF